MQIQLATRCEAIFAYIQCKLSCCSHDWSDDRCCCETLHISRMEVWSHHLEGSRRSGRWPCPPSWPAVSPCSPPPGSPPPWSGHVRAQFYLKVSQFLHLQPVLSSANCFGFDQSRHPAAEGCQKEKPHHRSQADHQVEQKRQVCVCTVSRSRVHCGRQRVVCAAAPPRKVHKLWQLAVAPLHQEPGLHLVVKPPNSRPGAPAPDDTRDLNFKENCCWKRRKTVEQP